MAVAAMFVARVNESSEERMRRKRLGFEFGMKLNADEPGMIWQLDDLDVDAVRSLAGDAESCGNQRGLEIAIEFVAVAVPL